MNEYIRELAAALEDAASNDGISLSETDTAICAAALRFLAAASEAVQAMQATTVDLLTLPLTDAAA